MTKPSDRVRLSTEQAIELLPDGEAIHTFRQSPLCLIGADWTRQQVVAAIGRWGAELSGPAATKAGHGLVVIDDQGPVFIATREVMLVAK